MSEKDLQGNPQGVEETEVAVVDTPKPKEKKIPFWKRLLFSKTVLSKDKSHVIAYVAVLTTFAIAANFLDISLMDVKFSFSSVVASLIGILLGPLYGFCACFVGDFIGYLINPYNMYMYWVGLSTGCFALLSGLIFNLIPVKKKWFVFVKLAVICLTTFIVCTITINSTGFYFYNKLTNPALIEAAGEKFGGQTTYWAYVIYRLFFKGQIWNSLANYALLFLAVPALNGVKALKLDLY